jgi:hypothetical protein
MEDNPNNTHPGLFAPLEEEADAKAHSQKPKLNLGQYFKHNKGIVASIALVALVAGVGIPASLIAFNQGGETRTQARGNSRIRPTKAPKTTPTPTPAQKPPQSEPYRQFDATNSTPITLANIGPDYSPMDINGVYLTLTQQSSNTYFRHWATYLEPFLWHQGTTAAVYGWTTAPCTSTHGYNLNAVTKDGQGNYNLVTNVLVDFPGLSASNCAPDTTTPGREGWNSFKSTYGYAGNFNETIEAVALVFAPGSWNSGSIWDVANVEINGTDLQWPPPPNPTSPPSPTPIQPTPTPALQSNTVTSLLTCSDKNGTNLAATGIKWTAVSGADYYQVQFCTGNATTCDKYNESLWQNVPNGASIIQKYYHHTGLAMGQYYTYRVRGMSNTGMIGSWTTWPLSITPNPTCNVFISSQPHNGYFGSNGSAALTNADAFCNSLASTTNPNLGVKYLDGTFRTWLSTSSTTANSRLTNATFRNLSGTIIANTKADLTDGTIDNPITHTEQAAQYFDRYVFTGTDAQGTTLSNSNCNDWTTASSGYTVASGDNSATDFNWSNWTVTKKFGCTESRPFYCFQTSGIVGNAHLLP